jgi:outer membrane immunogenic protein
MRTRILAILFAGLLPLPALAADVEVAPEPEPLVYDWTGFYLGAHVGYGEVQVDGLYDDGGATDFTFGLEPNGILGGLHAGYDLQLGSFVIGAEGDFSWVNWDDSITAGGLVASAEADWLATLRGRLGVALDNFLLYGTVGAAWTDAEASVTDGPTASVEFDDVALVAGGGVEWGFNQNLSVKLEGLWFNFDESNTTAPPFLPGSGNNDFIKLDDAWVVQTGVRLRF